MCAAIAAAGAAVASTAVAGYGAYAQGAAADEQMEAIQGDKEGAYGRKQDPTDFPGYDRLAGSKDFNANLPMLNTIASKVNNQSNRLRDKNSGGMFTKNVNQSGANIQSMLKGEVPQDVVDETMRNVAEAGAGAYSPDAPDGFGGTGDRMGDDFSRRIGKTSYDISTQGLSMAPQWEGMVDAFTYKPQDAAQGAMAFLKSRHEWISDKYIGDVNAEKTKAGGNPQVAGFLQDSMKLQALESQANQNFANAAVGMVNAGSNLSTAINQPNYKPNSTGGYETAAAAIRAGGAGSTATLGPDNAYHPTRQPSAV